MYLGEEPLIFIVKVLVPSKIFNPNPHRRGRICQHFFQRPITQKVLSAKNQQQISMPRITYAESLSWVVSLKKRQFMPVVCLSTFCLN